MTASLPQNAILVLLTISNINHSHFMRLATLLCVQVAKLTQKLVGAVKQVGSLPSLPTSQSDLAEQKSTEVEHRRIDLRSSACHAGVESRLALRAGVGRSDGDVVAERCELDAGIVEDVGSAVQVRRLVLPRHIIRFHRALIQQDRDGLRF